MKKINLYIFEDYKTSDLYPITINRQSFEVVCGASTFIDRIKYKREKK